RLVIGIAKQLSVEGGAWIREHWNRIAHPDSVPLQIVLPFSNFLPVVVLGQNQVGLHPRNALASIHQQFRYSFGGEPAVFVKLITAFDGNRFNAALHRYAMRLAEQV